MCSFYVCISRSTTTEANPNVTGKDSTMSNASQGSEGSSSSSNSSIDGDFDYPSGWDSDDEDSGFSNVSLKVKKNSLKNEILINSR